MSDKIVDRTGLKAFRQKLDDKYVIEGEYSPETSVGKADVADNLSAYGPNSGATDNTLFVFQSSGGGSDIGSLAQLKSLRGNTIVWNQLIGSPTTDSSNGITMTNNGDGSLTFSGIANADTYFSLIGKTNNRIGHKILVKGNPEGASSSTYGLDIGPASNISYSEDGIYTIADSATFSFSIKNGTDFTIPITIVPQIFDLTQMFGAGNEPESVVDFNRLFPEPYYDYNDGELKSCQSSAYKTVGYNAFDEIFKQGSPQPGNTNAKVISSTNPIKVIPGQTYTFEASNFSDIAPDGYYIRQYASLDDITNDVYTSQNFDDTTKQITINNDTQYVMIQINFSVNTTPSSDNVGKICFHLTWDESKTGYEPYEAHNYALPNIELKSAGNAYDEITPDGNLIRRVGSIDLGTLITTQTSNSSGVIQIDATSTDIILVSDYLVLANLVCAKYSVATYSDVYGATTKKSIATTNKVICIQDDDFIEKTAQEIKNLLSGVYLYYELATPTTTQSDSYKYLENTAIDDWGTQEFVGNGIPQGNDFFYIVDYKAFIDSLGERQDIEYDASEVVSHSELTQALSNVDLSGYGSLTGNNVWTEQNQFKALCKTNETSGYRWEFGSAEGFTFVLNRYVNTTLTQSFVFDLTVFRSNTDNTVKLGTYDKRWANVYTAKLSNQNNNYGVLMPDTTNWTANKTLATDDQVLNVINATDIVNNTLTQAQYDLITNGKPTLISGILRNDYINPLLANLYVYSGTMYGIIISSGRPSRIATVSISTSTKVISIEASPNIRLEGIDRINGKTIPAYPSNTGTFVLKCVDGVLTWVAE